MTVREDREKLYKEREKRISDAVSLKKPDRVPIGLLVHYYANRMMGISNKDAITDYSLCLKAFRDLTLKLKLDLAPTPYPLLPAKPCALLGLTQYRLPGYGLDDNASHQYVEKEYMLEEEYDEFLANPEGFAVRKIWPRIATAFEPLAGLPPIYMMLEARGLVMGGGTLAGMPVYSDLLKTLLEFRKEASSYNAAVSQYTTEMAELGFPLLCSAGARTPFDFLSDFLRGIKGSSTDMYRVPEKLLKAIDILTPACYQTGLNIAKRSGNPRVLVTLHRGAGGFMSDGQFSKFYWPGLKKVLLALVDAGLTPMVFLEGDYTPRLEYLAELPRGKVVGHFEHVDLRKAKKIIGDMICFWGNVSAQALIVGKPEQVRDEVRNLIDTFGDNGGLIIDGSVGIPDEAKPENLEAMMDAVFKYGVY